MKIIINYIFVLISFFLSYIIPKKNNLYIFWSLHWRYYNWNTKFLYLYMKKNYKNYNVFFITKSKKIYKNNNNLIYLYTIKGILLLFRAKYIFITHWISDISITNILIWNFNIINLWHWEPLKKMWFSISNKKTIYNFLLKLYINKMYKFTICCSDFSKKSLWEAFKTKNIIITGLPRNDFLISKIKKIKKKNKYKIILYAPTFRDWFDYINPFSIWFYKELNNFCIKNNIIFYIKLHPNTKYVLNLKEKFSNIKIKDNDIQELLLNTDILITDYSSLYIDFLLTKKPIIFYSYDLEKYVNDRWFYIKYKKWVINKTLIYKEKDLINILNNYILFNDKDYIDEYNILLNFFHKYKDNNSCERILHYLLKK